MKLVKGDKVRIVEGNPALVDALKQVGYIAEGKEAEKDILDRDALKAEADALEIEYPKNINTEKLYQLIWDAKAE